MLDTLSSKDAFKLLSAQCAQARKMEKELKEVQGRMKWGFWRECKQGMLTCEAAEWTSQQTGWVVYKGEINEMINKHHLAMRSEEVWEDDGVVGFCRQEARWFCLTLEVGHTLLHSGRGRGRDLAPSGQAPLGGPWLGWQKLSGRTADNTSGSWFNWVCTLSQGRRMGGFC